MPKNRPEGQVRERIKGHIYEIRWSAGKDPATGKRRVAIETVRGTRQQARDALRERLKAKKEGMAVEPSRQTVRDWLDEWLKLIAPEVSAKTLERYTEHAKHYLKPEFGETPLQQLQLASLQAAYSKWTREGRRDGKTGGLEPNTIRGIHRVLNAALNRAVELGKIARNPWTVQGVSARRKRLPKVRRKAMVTLTPEQSLRLLAAIKHTRTYWPVLVASYTGMRRGEVLGLRWRNVDFAERVIRVEESLEQTKAGLGFKEPKSGKGRSISLSPIAAEELRRHKREQAEELLKLGIRQDGDTLVCRRADPFTRDGTPCPKGAPLPPHSLGNEFKRLVRLIPGLPGITFHGLRHSHATQLLGCNVHPKIVQERLGHSGIAITLDLYSHAIPNMQEEAVAKLDAALAAAMSGATAGNH